MGKATTVTIEDCNCIKESDSGKALLVEVEGDEVWIPKSVIHSDSDVYKPDTSGDLVIFQWFAEKEGLG